jgi:hypothetical protein
MTDTPDALMNEFADEVKLYGAMEIYGPVRHKLRARLTAGDAAIADKKIIGDTLAATVVQLNDTQAELDAATKRVAELEQECEEYEQQMSAGRALYLKSVEDLAAALDRDGNIEACVSAIAELRNGKDADSTACYFLNNAIDAIRAMKVQR